MKGCRTVASGLRHQVILTGPILTKPLSGGSGIHQPKVFVLPRRITRLIGRHLNLDRDLGTRRPMVGRNGLGLKYGAEAKQDWTKYFQDGVEEARI